MGPGPKIPEHPKGTAAMTKHQYCALTFVGEEAFCVIPHYGAQGPPWAPGPKFLNTPKVRLLDYHYDRTSVLCTNICGRRSILRDSTLWGPGPTMGPRPKIPEHPEGTAVRLSL